MCTNFHYDSDAECAEEGHLFEERIEWIQAMIKTYDIYQILKTPLNAIQEAYDRNCYLEDPHFPGEE